jgi:hypothetical protein
MQRFPVRIVDVEERRELEQIRDAEGKVVATRPIPGSERAYLKLDFGGLTIQAAVTLEDLNRIISIWNLAEEAGHDPKLSRALARLEAIVARMIAARVDARLEPIVSPFDEAIGRAKELLKEINRPG